MWTYIKLLLLGSVIVILSIYYRMSHSRRLSGEDTYLYEVLELEKGIQVEFPPYTNINITCLRN